ncbi:MAG: hypothetical protein ACLRMJ_05690 [Alistipes finegoldii]
MKADMEYVQRVKAPKWCTTITGWSRRDRRRLPEQPQKEEYFGWKPEWDTPGWRPPTAPTNGRSGSLHPQYARMLADSVYTGGYSGIDLTMSRTPRSWLQTRAIQPRQFYIFVDELGNTSTETGTDNCWSSTERPTPSKAAACPISTTSSGMQHLLRFDSTPTSAR